MLPKLTITGFVNKLNALRYCSCTIGPELLKATLAVWSHAPPDLSDRQTDSMVPLW